MKKILLAAFLQSIITFQTFSQPADTKMVKEQFQDYNFIPGNYMRSLPGPAPEVKGSFYYDEQWHKGTIYLNKGMKTGELPIRYDIVNNLLEIKHEDKVKVLQAFEITKFVLDQITDEVLFSNVKNYKGGEPLRGFVKILTAGKFTLASYTSTELSRPNYNVALNVGEKDAKVVKKEKLYLITEGSLQELPGKKYDFMLLFGDKAAEVEKYMNSNRYSHKNKADLLQTVNYYNSIAP